MKKSILLGALVFLSANFSAQISNNDLVKMKEAGLSEEIIKTKIATEDSQFDVSTNALLELKNKGFSDDVISLMIQKNEAIKAYTERGELNSPSEESNAIYSIVDKGNHLLINDKIELKQGDEIQVYLPARGEDFMFVKQQASGLSAKLIGKIAGAVETGAVAVGLGSSNASTTLGALKVINKASAVQYGADALQKINDLPISKKAKKIAGKKMKVTGWKKDGNEYTLNAEFEKKKYDIHLFEALMTGEIKLK